MQLFCVCTCGTKSHINSALQVMLFEYSCSAEGCEKLGVGPDWLRLPY